MRIFPAVLAALLAVAGCATAPPSGEAAAARGPDSALDEFLPYAGAPVPEFHFFTLDNWQSAGPRHVVVWTSPSTAYLVRVMTPCPELQFTERLAVTSTVGTISRFESVIPRHGLRCPIEEIRPVDVRRMNAERAAKRRAERAAAGQAR